MPRDLMGEWGLVRRPNTDRMYLLPVDVLKDSLHGRQSGTVDQAQNSDAEVKEPHKDVMDSETTMKNIRDEKVGHQLIFRMVNLLSPLRRLSEPLERSSGKKPAASRLLPFRWKHPQGPITMREEKQLVWMDDMPQYLFQRMRNDVSKKLESACHKFKHIGAANGVWSTLDMKDQSDLALSDALQRLNPVDRMECGAVLYLGHLKSDGQAEDLAAAGSSLSETALLPLKQVRVPVFDLSLLLSETDLTRLRAAAALHFQHSALYFRPDDSTGMELMLSLWKLQRFLAEDAELER